MMMSQIWLEDRVAAVTPIQAGPCVITQVKNEKKDGYSALQLAYGVRHEKNINKPQRGHYKATGVKPSFVREFRLDDTKALKAGDVVTVGTFSAGDIVAVTGISKGKGFQGVVKRHHFAGGRKTHGNKDQERMPGSIGPKGPAHVFKGTRMGGRMGGERVTVTNLEVASIDEENNIIYIKGAVPGAINGYLMIKGKGDLQVNITPQVAEVAPEVAAETEVEAEPVVEIEPVAEVQTEGENVSVAGEEVKEEEATTKEEQPVAKVE